MDVIEQLSLVGLVPVIKVEDANDAVPLCKALADGGLPVAEITFRSDAAEEAIRRVHAELPEVILGAGTVLTPEQVDRAMAADWRAHFTHPDGFPIFLVQLASIDAMHGEPVESNWAWMRWTQMRLGETIDKCGTAVIIDIDEHKEMHPKDKKTVGERLARLALVRAYGETNVCESSSLVKNRDGRVISREYRVDRLVEAGPIPTKAERRDGRVVIAFKNAEGLKTSDGKRLRGFQLKGENGESAFWQGHVLGETVVIHVPADFRPVRVRYAWDDFPDCNLVNGEGLPCGPFEFGLE